MWDGRCSNARPFFCARAPPRGGRTTSSVPRMMMGWRCSFCAESAASERGAEAVSVWLGLVAAAVWADAFSCVACAAGIWGCKAGCVTQPVSRPRAMRAAKEHGARKKEGAVSLNGMSAWPARQAHMGCLLLKQEQIKKVKKRRSPLKRCGASYQKESGFRHGQKVQGEGWP